MIEGGHWRGRLIDGISQGAVIAKAERVKRQSADGGAGRRQKTTYRGHVSHQSNLVGGQGMNKSQQPRIKGKTMGKNQGEEQIVSQVENQD